MSVFSFSQRTDRLTSSQIREVSESGADLADVIELWFGEGRWPTSQIAIKAVTNALASADHFYQPNSGKPAFRQALASYVNRLYNRSFTPEHITVTASGMQAIMLIAQALIDPDDEVVIIAPIWPNLVESFKLIGGNVKLMNLRAVNNRWHLDMDKLLSMLGSHVKAVVINSPHNPTGWVMSKDEQIALLTHCRKNGIWIIGDDVYARLYRHGDVAPSFAEFYEEGDKLICVNSFSKAWSMTGWRLGWIVAPSDLTLMLAKLTEFNTACVSGAIQEAGLAMITQGEAEIAKLQQHIHTAFTLTQKRLAAIDRINFIEPEGAFYSFFHIDGVTDSLSFAKKLLQEVQLGLAPGTAFGDAGQGYLRLCYAQEPALLATAFDRLETGISRLL